MKEEMYLWITAIVVGLASMWLIPAKKLSKLNRRFRDRINGKLLAVLFFLGVYVICKAANVNAIARNIMLGALIGLFVGFIPVVDKRNYEEKEENEEKEEDEDDRQ